MKDNFFSNFVCNKCFLPLEECTCQTVPDVLVAIDPGIQEAIRILNSKGWKTAACCEGHFEPELKWNNMYILFKPENYYPPFFPDGWEVSRSGGKLSIHGKIDYSSKIPEKKAAQYRTNKEQRMTELMIWVNSLPVNDYVPRRWK